MTYKLAAVAVLALAVAGSARAASNQGSADEDNGSRTFAGLHFGVALSVTHDLDDNRVEDAIIEYELENGTAVPKVRVTRTNNTRARLMLETHYFFLPDRVRSAVEAYEASDRKSPSPSLHGWGPFVALQPGSEEIVEALGAGIMWGWRKSVESNRSFNLAFGVVTDNNVKVLGNGFIEDQEAPRDQNGDPLPIRFKETDQFGILLLSSFNF